MRFARASYVTVIASLLAGSLAAAHTLSTVADPTLGAPARSLHTMNRAHWESRFYDKDSWGRYFDLLAASRFNRYLITFDNGNGGFLAPPYPCFFDTPSNVS